MTPTAWLSRAEAAERLRCSPHTVDRRVRDGKLTKYTDGGLVRFKTEDIDALLSDAVRCVECPSDCKYCTHRRSDCECYVHPEEEGYEDVTAYLSHAHE